MPTSTPETIAIRRDAVIAALTELKPWLKKLRGTKAKAPSLVEASAIARKVPLKAAKFGQTIHGKWGSDGNSLFKTMLLHRLLEQHLSPLQLKRGLKVDYAHKPKVFYGDLKVSGNLTVLRPLVVLGDLDVGGAITDGDGDICVAGSIRAGSMSRSNSVWVGGGIEAKAVCEPYGTVCAVDGLRADFVFTGVAEIFGSVSAKLAVLGSKPLESWWANKRVTPELEAFELELAELLVDELDPRSVRSTSAGERIVRTVERCHARIQAGKPFLAGKRKKSKDAEKTAKPSGGEKSPAIDRAQAVASVPRLKSVLKRLPKDDLTLAPNLARTKALAKELPTSTAELAAQIGTVDDLDGALNFVQVLLVDAGLRERPKAIDKTKNLTLAPEDGPGALIAGAVRVGGNLSTNRHLVVFGDLEVGGELEIWDYTTRVFVTGNVKCNGLNVSGSLWVGGDIDAAAAIAGYRSRLFCTRLRAHFLNEDAESQGVFAKVEAQHHFKRARWESDPEAVLKQLAKILLPAALKGAETSLADEALMKLAAAGKPFLLNGSKSSRTKSSGKVVAASNAALPRKKVRKKASAGRKAQRFEFSKGASKKFWEIQVRGSGYAVTFGRIGTDGQTKEKTMASAAAAREAADKLVKSKLAKGYKRA